jgi:Ca2+:H+ antiporter
VCLLAIIPLEKLFDYGGEQMAFYLGKDIGDLVVVTLNNAVEATLAIILLKRCELRLLQSTILGVVILHLLLVPGTAFIVGGARVMHQDLHPHLTEINHSLLVMGYGCELYCSH